MKISNIEIKNFKSFKNMSVSLNDFNVVVGQSASGKSNFVEAFDFLRDIAEDFEKGVYDNGNMLIQNLNCNRDTPSCIKATVGDGNPFVGVSNPLSKNGEEIITMVWYTSIEYELCIKFRETEIDYITEIVKLNFNIYDDEDSNLLSDNALYLKNDNGNISVYFEEDETYADLEFFAPKALLNIVNNNFKEKIGLIINSPLSAVPISWSNYFKDISSFNFDPNISKMGDFKGNGTLSKYGDNLPIVLDTIISDEDKKRKFLNLVSILLPYVEDIEVRKMDDDTRIFRLIESYTKVPVFAPFISDGTANILALISAIYFSKRSVILIEEPERNIHPGLLMQLVDMMKEVSSQNKQIIITTHSPEILNNCDLEDILFISRDENGFSTFSKPSDNDDVREFIKELTIGELFMEGCLGDTNE